jgi:hypothetical protein
MWYMDFWAWPMILNIMNSSSNHFPANDIILFFFMAE